MTDDNQTPPAPPEGVPTHADAEDAVPFDPTTWAGQFERLWIEPELVAAMRRIVLAGNQGAETGIPNNYMFLIALALLAGAIIPAPPAVYELVRRFVWTAEHKPRQILGAMNRTGLALGMTPRVWVEPPSNGQPQ